MFSHLGDLFNVPDRLQPVAIYQHWFQYTISTKRLRSPLTLRPLPPLGISRPKASYAPLLNLLEGSHTGLLLVGGPCEGDGWPGCAGEHCDEW